MKRTRAATVAEYIALSPPSVRPRLEQLRDVVRKAAPEAKERIGYGIPTFAQCGNLVHFAAYERHVGFYPGASAIAKFANELAPYATSKGTVQFPHNLPVPLGLVRKIVKFRLEENLAKQALRGTAKTAKRSRKKAAAKK